MAAVQFAADYNLKVSALGSGHQLAGIALLECGVTIEMYKFQKLNFDPATNLATVGASPRPRSLLFELPMAHSEIGWIHLHYKAISAQRITVQRLYLVASPWDWFQSAACHRCFILMTGKMLHGWPSSWEVQY